MEKESLLHQIMQMDFACVDMHLYLNTHPTDNSAIMQLNHFGSEVRRLTQEYEKKFGPLSYTSAHNSNTFDWINEPWPWQLA
ncbi:MAG: spore coat protein CotJB [Firmicutes bacterium]|nr:spore coat protein CotJB [Bacillota bacterium]